MEHSILNHEVNLTRLRCEYLNDPIGLGIKVPRLSWEIVSSKRGTMQTAYQILVAAEADELVNQTNLVWDTGKVISASSVHNEYQGPALQSRQRYYWMVRIWDEAGAVSLWSEVAFWEMGLLKESDWKAQWVEPVQRPVQKEKPLSMEETLNYKVDEERTYDELNPCPLLRKEFRANDSMRRARIYATAHGLYALELNGRRVGDNEFAPDSTAYDKYLMVQTYDVTALIVSGDNAIGAILGDGWYAGRLGVSGDSGMYGDRLGLLLQLEIEYEDGSRQTVISDRSFKSGTGPLRYSDIFIGERYDARLENPEWSMTGFDDQYWMNVNSADYGYQGLVAHYGEPVRAICEIKPVGIMTTPRGETVIDLGQNIAGRMRMKVRGPAGTEVILQHSEVLDEQGNFLLNIMGRNKDQKDVYVLKGNGEEETFEPRFTFHGFRYVKVTGYPEQVTVDKFTGVVLSSDMFRSGSFECSDARINRLQSNILWSQRSNMLSIPTDCPQRERAGWTGDIQIYAPTACYNMDVAAFLTRWLRNLALEQKEDGQVTNIVPYWKEYEKTDFMLHGKYSSAGWGDACIIVPWTLYTIYGDVRVLAENYPTMARWVAYIEKTAAENLPEHLEGTLTPERREHQKYLWNTGFHFGDWLTPSVSIDLTTGEVDMIKSADATKELVSTCFYAYSTGLMAKIAALLGMQEKSQHYAFLNKKIKEAFTAEYLDQDGTLKTKLQGVCVLALQLDMIPEDKRKTILDQLIGLVEQNGNRLDTGFVSIPFLMDVLCDNGRRDVAVKLLYQTECPSWLYEVNKGATTIWEAWQAIMPNGKVSNVSYNHYAFGCIGNWLYRAIAGINAGQPGYKHIEIKPEPDGKMSYAQGSYHSVYGNIVAGWKLEDGKMTVNVTIPPNTTASVWLPRAALAEVTETGQNIAEITGIFSSKQIGEKAVLEIGSGDYEFAYRYQSNG